MNTNSMRIAAAVLSFTLVLGSSTNAAEIVSVFDQEVARFKRLAASKHSELRVEAAQGFKYLKYRAGEAALLPLAADSDLIVRLEAVKALGVCGGRQSVGVLIDRLSDTEWEVRTRAHIALCGITGQSFPADAADKWKAWLTGTNWAAKEDLLLRAVNGPDLSARRRALRALRAIGSRRCEPQLLACLKSKLRMQGEDHGLLAKALERIGSEKSLGYLTGLAQHRMEALWALGEIGGPRAETALLKALQKFGARRCDAMINLDRLKSGKCRPMIPMLLQAFGLVTFRSQPDELHRPPHVRQRAAANLILRTGQADKLADLILAEVEGKRDDAKTPADLRAPLAAMREELKPGFVRKDGQTVAQPLAALPHITRDKRFTPRLIALMDHKAFLVRIYAATTLGALKDPRGVQKIVQVIRQPYGFVDATTMTSGKHFSKSKIVRWRGYLCMALGRLGGQQARATLETLASDPKTFRDLRYGSVAGLRFLKSPESLTVLRRIAKQDIIWAIRQEAAQAIRDIELSRPGGRPVAVADAAKSPAPRKKPKPIAKQTPPPAKLVAEPALPKKPPLPTDGNKLMQAVMAQSDADAAVALARQGAKALPLLRRGLANRRAEALIAWALWKHPLAGTGPQLQAMLKSTNQVAGYWAARALGTLKDRKSVKALADMLPKDPNGYWEFGWGKRIRLRSKNAKKVKTPEFGSADMPNIRVTYAAIEALGQIGGPEARACLIKALASPQYLIRYGAARGLGAMKAQQALASLTKLSTADPVLIVRQSAGQAVAKIQGAWREPATAPPPMPKALLFIKTANRTESNLGFRDSYSFPKTPWYNSGENLYVLSPVGPGGSLRNLTRLKGGAVQGPELSHDGKRVLFGMRTNAKTKGFGIYEMNLDGTGLQKLTDGNCNDVDPCYLPDGRIMFCSDRAGYREFYHQERSRVLYVMNADGSDVRQVTFNPNQDYEPLVLRSGEVLYSSYRFYAQDGSPGPVRGDRFMQRIETVFRTIRPDGSNDQLFYGAMRGAFYCPLRPMPYGLQYTGWHRRGNHIGVSVSQAKQMPDGGVVCITPAGLTRLDARRTPLDCEQPLYPEILNLAGGEETYIHNYDNLNPIGRFTTPVPAGGDWVFVSHAPWYKPGGKAYGIYLCHMPTRRMIPIYDDPNFSDVDPVPVVSRRLEPVLAPNVAGQSAQTGTIYCASVYNTDLPFDKKSIKYVRVISALYQPLSINANASFRTRDLGTVRLDEDGSFNVEVPADTPLRFELLDTAGRVVVHETALNYVRPGERKGCVGCHEPKDMTLGASRPKAVRRRPARTVAKRGDLIYMGRPERTYNLIVRD
ncbi:MAG: hypothetical protein HN350_08000 [Phycisphaerales bacterium]|nr:hypothetical protein [Phycisphaerales bacterium]